MIPFEIGFFSIPVTKMDKAKFFEPLMGWKFQNRDPDFCYIFAADRLIGSLEIASDLNPPSEHGPLMYFRAEFMTKTLEQVKTAGGAIKETSAIEGGARGFTAKVLDPFGNRIAFWAPEN